MSPNLSGDSINQFRNGRAILWLCQRYELRPNEETHDLGEDPEVLQARYREEVTALDDRIASFAWEAIWSDSCKGLIAQAVTGQLDRAHAAGATRRPVILASNPDEEGQLNTRELLPIYFPLGLLNSTDPEGLYTKRISLRRQNYRFNALRKVESYPNRLLVVLGATDQLDLDPVFEMVSEFAPVGLSVHVVWPSAGPEVEIPDTVHVPVQIWKGSIDSFLDRLDNLKIPHVDLPTKRRLRVGETVLALDEADLVGITDRFVLILDDDLLKPDPTKITRSTLEEFLKGTEADWRGYAAGLAFDRQYTVPGTGAGLTLARYLKEELESQVGKEISNLTVVLPAENGAGLTTLLRSAAFAVASGGFPVLLLRQHQTSLDIDEIAAFLNRLVQRASPDVGNTPVLMVFDVDHEFIAETAFIAQTLAALGRAVVVLRAESAMREAAPRTASQENATSIRIRGKSRRLPILSNTISHTELARLADHFQSISRKYPISIEAPALDEWQDYQAAQSFVSPDGGAESDSLFWVALYFFFFNRSEPVAGFDDWIQREYEAIQNGTVREAVRRIAALSAFRLVTPLTPLLRSLGRGYDMGLINALAKLDDRSGLLRWDSRPKDLEDQALRFRHPLLAQRLLLFTDRTIADFPVEITWPILENLKGGRRADVWLGESVAFQVLRTERRSLIPGSQLEKKLETFGHIPPQISEYSKPILHHWARALYHRAQKNPEDTESVAWLGSAVEKLERAIALPAREERDEHPSHLYTTLGTIYFEISKRQVLRNQSSGPNGEWEKAARCFEKALVLIGDNYQALAAYSQRLIERASGEQDPARMSDDILRALSYLDQAEEVARQGSELSEDDRFFLDSQRNSAWQILDPARAQIDLDGWLRDHLEIGYLIKARSIIRDLDLSQLAMDPKLPSNLQGVIAEAIGILESGLLEMRGQPTWRSLHLLYRLYAADPKDRFAFDRRLKVLEQLERTDFKWYVRMRFEHAVLCYQNGKFAEGQRRFREVRAILRQPDQPAVRLADFWRRKDDPTKPRATTLVVRRRDSDFRGYGFIEEMGQEVLFRPRHFEVPPRPGDFRQCHVRFETMGPMAVPTNFPTTGS